MTFTLHTDPDGLETWVTVDGWARTTLLSPTLIGEEQHGARIHLVGTVRFKVRNGDATYRITGWDEAAQALTLELLDWTGPTGA